MTVATTSSKISYTGNAVTTLFAFPYPFIAASDLQVYVAGVLKTLTTDYTISGTAPYPAGANVTFLAAPANLASIVIARVRPYTQTLDLVENDPLPADPLELDLDHFVMLAQQLLEITSRAPLLTLTSLQSNITIDDLVANSALVVNSGGTGITNGPTVAQITAAQGYAVAAAASASAAASSATLASQWATLTSGLVAATDYSSKAYAIGGTGVTGAAGAAKEWAILTSSNVDGGTGFSAKEFAQGAQASTGGSAKNWAQQTAADVTGAAVNSRSAKSWAQDNNTGATLGGSAKDWAQSASLPDGVLKSAKSYAADAQASAAAVNSIWCGTATGTNGLTLTPVAVQTSYTTGMRIRFLLAGANTISAVTVNVSALGNKNLKKTNASGAVVVLAIADLPAAGVICEAEYDGTQFLMLTALPFSLSASIATAGTLNLNTATGSYVPLTGTTTVTAITLASGDFKRCVAGSAFTLSNGASLIIPGGQNLNLQAGDIFDAHGEASSVVRITNVVQQGNWGTSYAARGWKNMLRNGSMMIQGRAAGTITSGTQGYALDGFIIAAQGGNITWSQSAGFGAPGNNGQLQSYLSINGGASNSGMQLIMRIRGDLAGEAANWPLLFSIGGIFNSSGGSVTPTIKIETANSLNNFGAVTTVLAATNMSAMNNGFFGSNTYIAAAIGSGALNGIQITINFGAFASGFYSISGVLAAAVPGMATGISVNPPQIQYVPMEVEQVRCNAYLPSFGETTGVIGSGNATSTTAVGFFIPYRTKTHTNATGITVTTVGNFQVMDGTGANVAALTALTFSSASREGVFVTGTVAAGLTSGVHYYLKTNTGLTGNLIVTGVEL